LFERKKRSLATNSYPKRRGAHPVKRLSIVNSSARRLMLVNAMLFVC